MVPKKEKKVCLSPSILSFVLKWWILTWSTGAVSRLHFSLFTQNIWAFSSLSCLQWEKWSGHSVLHTWCMDGQMDWLTDGLVNLTFRSFLNMNAVAQVEERRSYYWVLRNAILSLEWQNTDLFNFFFQFPLPCRMSNCAWCSFLLILQWTFSGFCIVLFFSVSWWQWNGEDGWDLLSWVWIVPLFSTRPSLFIWRRGSLF